MELHNYQSSTGRDLIMESLNSLPEEEKLDGLQVLDCMQNNKFDHLLYKRWEKKVYEVYFRKNNRIFYVVADTNNIYILHVCRKQKNKTEKNDSKIVKKRAKELGNLLGIKFI